MNRYPLTSEHHHLPAQIARILRVLGVEGLPAGILEGPATAHRGNAADMVNAVHQHVDHLEAAAQAVLRGEDPTEHLVLHAAWSNFPALIQRIDEGSRDGYMALLNTHADLILRAVREQIFEPALDELQGLVDEHPEIVWDEMSAAMSGDYKAAVLIRDAQPLAARLAQAVELREKLHPRAFDDEAAWALEPGALNRSDPEPGKLTFWVGILGAGLTPDYPTIREWEERRDSEQFAGPEAEPLVSRAWVTRD
ncbi:hypothetical protein SCMU_27780 [Sinomonas cyclohexanicum]|uniref:Uncharacterized protein n=1 Tax=Sinomonas cyclohexanicum TaxID=322009 RepID=A0ABM7PXC0_SINCY|nr:hypothetical protein [Corynebacterium cyclohexanicum]BCT76936.1 hypothetical protein SCMU_27780 [Corynebacterium cyclohexanicum]